MRVRAYSVVSFAVCIALASRTTVAAPAEGEGANAAVAAERPEATAEARRHFKLGIKLYQDTNYAGALAEFEAAYAIKPSVGSLQNVALCQKALFRYREAAATLAQLLSVHGAELRDGEKNAISEAMTELRALVGSIVVNVEPSDAKLTLDGRAVATSELRMGIEVNVGEHSLVADSPGYARLLRVVSVASGQKPLLVELKLKATDGFLNVVASDPHAAIAIDGVTRAFHEWRGGVKPDVEHLVQVFRDGYESYEGMVSVGLGKTLDVQATLGARIEGTSDEVVSRVKPGAMPAPPPPHVPRGYYGLLTLGALGLGQRPLGLTATRSNRVMGSIGVRAGYRLWAPVAAELLLDAARLSAEAHDGEVTRNYALTAARFGPNLRLMTTGKSLRLTAAIGAGIVRHKLVLDPVSDSSASGGTASGYDPYFLLELGLQWSVQHFLLGVEGVILIDGATNLNQKQVEGAQTAFGNTNTLPLFGLGIHGGYALW